MKRLIAPLALLPAIAAAGQEQQQPNIVMLFVDDMGWADFGMRNPDYETPNLDRLTQEGLNFNRAYVSTATSSPSRASIMTGKEALRCGFVRHIYGNDPDAEFESLDTDPGHMLSRAYLPLEEITYAERLKEYGYYNCFVGKWHLGNRAYFPDKQGFDEMRGTTHRGHPDNYYYPFFNKRNAENPFKDSKPGDYLTDKITDEAVDFLQTYEGKAPFLLNVWYYTVHSPQIGKKELIQKYLDKGFEGQQADYAAKIEVLDNSIGRIRETLEKEGLADNTVIIFASDQGGAYKNGHLRGGKMGGETLCEGGSRIPMVIYAPGSPVMGTTCYDPIQTIDVFPTLVELASRKKCKDKQINGVSLLPLLDGKKLADRDLFMHRSYEDQNCCIMRGDWKLIKYRSGKLELYNLKEDESEQHNLVEAQPKLAAKLLKALNKWQKEATPSYLLTNQN